MKFRIFILTLFLISLLSLAGLCEEEKIELVELNADNFQEEVLECDVPVVVYFWASWCKACKTMSTIIKWLAIFHEEKVKFIKVNMDKSRRKFLNRFRPFRGLPVLIFFKNGEEVDRIIGLLSFKIIHNKIIFLLEEDEKKEKKEDYCGGRICHHLNNIEVNRNGA